MDFSIANCCFSAFHDPNRPKYLPIKLQESKRSTGKDNEMMVDRGENNSFSYQVFTTFNNLRKVIWIIDRKYYFRENQKNIMEIGLLPELCRCDIMWHLAFLVLLILNHRFSFLISPWVLEFQCSTCKYYFFCLCLFVLVLFGICHFQLIHQLILTSSFVASFFFNFAVWCQ